MCQSDSEKTKESFTRYIFYTPDISDDHERIAEKSKVDKKTIKMEVEPQSEKDEDKSENMEIEVRLCVVSL